MSLSALIWTLGQMVYTYYGITRDQIPFPSLADAGYLGYFLPAAAALLAFPRPAGRIVSSLRLALDALVIGTSVLFVSYATVLDHVIKAGGLATLPGLVGIAYPVVDIAICAMVLTLGMRQPSADRLSWLFLGAGLLTLAVTDSIYVRLLFEGQTALVATPLTAGWMLAFLLIALATMVPQRGSNGASASQSALAVDLVPYLPVLAAIVVTALTTVQGRPLMIGIGISVLLCVTARQIMIVYENVALTSDLEAKVAARTAELNTLGSIVTSSDDAIVGVSLEGVITSWNPAAERLYGYRALEVVGRPPGFLDSAQLKMLHSVLDRAMHRETLPRSSIDWRREDGSVVPVEISVSPILDGGMVRGISIFGLDVTERRADVAALEDAREQAQESSRLKSEFLATMSHEIRTPMNGVIGLTSLLLQTPLDDVQQQYAEGVKGAGEALLTVINDILDFSKLEAGKVELESGDFEPRRLIEEVGSLLAPTAFVKQLELLAYCQPEVPGRLLGDAGRIRQVLLNLASNAVKFTEEGEVAIRVKSSTEADGRALVRFEVRDTGIGIADKDRERLFESFSQADASTTRRYGGTGLGLAISQRLVEAMEGRIGLSSGVGAGSTFWFEIPLAGGSAPPEGASLPNDDLLTGLRVLVVDDNATNRLILESQLTSWRLQPDLVDDAPSALLQMQHMVSEGRPYDVAVLDMCMPQIDGLELARSISADPALRTTRLIMLTSTFQVDSAALRGAGVTEWLTKPVRSSDFYDRLVRLMAPGAASFPTTGSVPAAAPPAAPARGRILVVEDNAVNQLVAEGVVSKLGYYVDIVANGAEALDAVQSASYSAVLMDCHMPVMDGFEATREIRRRAGSGSRIPIIAMTAGAMTKDRERCLAAGMDDYVSKPIDIQALERTLAQWVKPSSVPAIDQQRLASLRGLGSLEDSDLLSLIVDTYTRDGATNLAALREAAGASSASDLEEAAHRLRGSSGNIGAQRVAALCQELESRADSIDPADTNDLLNQVETELDRATTELANALSGAR